jgi:signal transduction histidine kinase
MAGERLNRASLRELVRLAFVELAFAPFSMVGVALFCMLLTFIGIIPVWVGIPLSLLVAAGLRKYADVHRRYAARVAGVEIERPYREPPAGGWLVARLRTVLTDPATWRDLAWTLVNASAGLALCLIPAGLFLSTIWYAILPFLHLVIPDHTIGDNLGIVEIDTFGTSFLEWPLGVLAFWLFWRYTRALVRVRARLNRWLLAPVPSASLARRVEELTESRAETVDTQAAELRRIERDLHDGAQARLVALGMSLGMAEEMVLRDPEGARELLAEARASSGAALSELRDLVRGIHPPVLADRGLDGAVRALALAGRMPVEVSIDLPGRPPEPVESAVYFAVAETLTNAAKHSGASSTWIRIDHTAGRLGVMIGDDGRGGAVIAPGGGLHGIERRLAAFDGTVTVASPAGGPTIVTMELPCALSSVKTSPSSGTA